MLTPDLRKLKKMAFEAIPATPASLAWLKKQKTCIVSKISAHVSVFTLICNFLRWKLSKKLKLTNKLFRILLNARVMKHLSRVSNFL